MKYLFLSIGVLFFSLAHGESVENQIIPFKGVWSGEGEVTYREYRREPVRRKFPAKIELVIKKLDHPNQFLVEQSCMFKVFRDESRNTFSNTFFCNIDPKNPLKATCKVSERIFGGDEVNYNRLSAEIDTTKVEIHGTHCLGLDFRCEAEVGHTFSMEQKGEQLKTFFEKAYTDSYPSYPDYPEFYQLKGILERDRNN